MEPLDAARRLEAWAAASEWTGSDPYDGLNASRIVGPLRASATGRRLVTQLVKRSPVDLRPLLGIRAAHSSAGISQALSAYARNGFLPCDEAGRKANELVALLERLRSDDCAEPCWGYHFDVQTRVFFYPHGVPNTIATAFATLGLLDAYERGGPASSLTTAIGAGDFFLRRVPQTDAESGAYFGYLVGDRTPIHNANMLVAATLARLARHTGRLDFRDAARAALSYTVLHQRADGSWPYGEKPQLSWIDGFHSGYVLECLMTCIDAGIAEDAEAALSRGLAFYRDNLFLRDGTPKYTPASIYPVDIQCAAQGIQTLSLAAAFDRSYADWARRVYEYTILRMRRPDGAFVFQRRRWWTNRAAHVRWAAAPMLLALTHLLKASEAA